MLEVVSHKNHDIEYLVSILKEMDAETKGEVDWDTQEVEVLDNLPNYKVTKVRVQHKGEGFIYTKIL